ncbi:hypothetical protein [Thermomonas alba]|uniref:hypothetical protein n=1 Tax=Thermomonas alba TaxID=2888525 RepID=UPI001F035C2D|nr:hypothetical protein [Thermomonas alba]
MRPHWLLPGLLMLTFASASLHATEPVAKTRDDIAAGAKLTKADAARTAEAGGRHTPFHNRITLDTARGATTAQPGTRPQQSQLPAPIECPPCGSLPATPKAMLERRAAGGNPTPTSAPTHTVPVASPTK